MKHSRKPTPFADKLYSLIEPNIIMMGCQAWPPYDPSRRCPVCGNGVKRGETTTICGWCQSVEPTVQKRCEAALRFEEGSERDKQAKAGSDHKPSKGKSALTERERRRIWCGYSKIPGKESTEPTNRQKVGQAWLVAIGQEPDWSIELKPVRGRR